MHVPHLSLSLYTRAAGGVVDCEQGRVGRSFSLSLTTAPLCGCLTTASRHSVAMTEKHKPATHATSAPLSTTPAAVAAADQLTSYTTVPAFRRLLTLVQLTCVRPACPVSLPAPHSVLLVSPPGTGKTTFVRLLSSTFHLPLVHIRPVALSPSTLASSFDEARRKQPSVLCMDDADQLLPRTSDDETWQHSLQSCLLDQLASLCASTERVLLVLLCSTAGVQRLAAAVRSAVEVTLEACLPTAAHRLSLLHHMLSPLCAPQSAAQSLPFLPAVAAECGGMSGADLLAVVREAAQHALCDERDRLTHADFQAALQLVSASSAGDSVKVDSEARVGVGRRSGHAADQARAARLPHPTARPQHRLHHHGCALSAVVAAVSTRRAAVWAARHRSVTRAASPAGFSLLETQGVDMADTPTVCCVVLCGVVLCCAGKTLLAQAMSVRSWRVLPVSVAVVPAALACR